MALEIGALLKNRYRIEEIIAKGGMGAVYRSRDESLGIVVAIKENFFTNEEHARQFRREATMLAGLRHPNLPRVTDHFTLPNQGQYLVMDFITGLDIRQRISQDGRLAESEVVEIGIAVSDALAYLHSREPAIVHRDIKPGNIKVAPNHQIYLVDFGLAKLSGQATTVGAQGLTPGYAPPEQYGQGTEPRSDIYALAATMYASLTGKVPEDALKRAMGTAKLVPIRSFNPTVSAPTAAAIEKAMAVSPDDRFAKAEAFKNALLQCRKAAAAETNTSTNPPAVSMADEKTQIDTRPPGTYRTGEIHTRRRFPALPVFGALGLLVLAAMVYFFVIRPGSKNPEATPITEKPSETLVQTETEIAATEVAAASPTFTQEVITPDAPPAGFLPGDGFIAFASDRETEPQIFLLNTQTGEIRRLKKMIGGACEPAWSPDGMSLAFISPCPKKAETHTGTTIYYITFKDDTLTTFDQFQLPTKTGGDFDPTWSADGQQISFTTMRESSNKIAFVYTYDLK
ncbi:MAG: protein kinase, partial [Anaerolineaceae bacterium]|nr:protein kinase [Anaerolineaceae bacterium]